MRQAESSESLGDCLLREIIGNRFGLEADVAHQARLDALPESVRPSVRRWCLGYLLREFHHQVREMGGEDVAEAMLSTIKAELGRLEELDSGAEEVGPSLFRTWARLSEGAALWESTIGPAQAETLGLSRETLQAGYLLVVDLPESLETNQGTSTLALAEGIGEIFDGVRDTVAPAMDAAITEVARARDPGP